jgi:hypothetical protein
MNSIAAIFMSLWIAGWAAAFIRAGLKARVAVLVNSSASK